MSFLEIVFVGKCEVFVSLDFDYFLFFPSAAKLIGPRTGCQFFKKMSIFPTPTPLRGGLSKKIDVIKELTPRLRTYELRYQGENKISTNSRQTNTSHCPTKTTSKNDHQPLKRRG